MKQQLKDHEFIDVQELLCGNNEATCSPFTATGDLISYDGTHLTRDGARFYGNTLSKYPLLKNHVN